MRKTSIIVCLAMITLIHAAIAEAQDKTVTNRYSTKLELNEDGSYSLEKKERYAKIISLDAICLNIVI